MTFRNPRPALLAVLLLLGFLCGSVSAKAEIVAARAAIESAPLLQGSSSRVAVEITVDKRYHIQSSKPLDEFLIPTAVSVAEATGITAGKPKYPVGEIVNGPPVGQTPTKLSAYQGKVYLLIPLAIAADAPTGKQTLILSLTTQACDENSCLPPATQRIKLDITIAAPGTATQSQNADLFAAAEKQKFAASATASAPTTTAIVPATTSAGTQSAAATLTASDIPLMTEAQQIEAIQSRHYRPYNPEFYPLIALIGLALLGGMILNIMPCVLPVIPLKVLSLVQQAHGDRRLAMLHGLTFSAGVISLFIALAVVLKTAGLFYGQQFQSPAFLIAMVLFVVALSLSMLGVWTLNPPRALYAAEDAAPHTGYLGSFSNGLMATLLATPCSAPYLGAVLAWALTQPGWLTALMLGLVGVGMSLPYLLLAIFPGALKKIPRAGRWSDLLKQGLGIVMIGVAVYLLTRIPNITYWPWVLAAGVLVSLVCWAWGQLPTFNMEPAKIWTIRGVSVAVGIVLGIGLYIAAARNTYETKPEAATGQWQTFNIALLDKALKENRPVVVDWTASWCINCHWLEATVLDTDSVQAAFKDKDVVLLKADLSTDNPPATLLNRELGGEAIPVLAIFSPGRPRQPIVLRDSYSSATLIRELNKAK